MGTPFMARFWDDLTQRKDEGTIGGDEARLLKLLAKTFGLLANDPFYPGLNSHEIAPLTRKVGRKVFQSYLENRKPAAGRIFWEYGLSRRQITIVGLEPHPESGKSRGYEKVKLSGFPET
jgi:hypothetical protein